MPGLCRRGPDSLSPEPARPGASFVTLTVAGRLRGCIGVLEAYQPLAEDVIEHAVAAALEDPRFPPVRPEELPHILVEVRASRRRARSTIRPRRNCWRACALIVDGVILGDRFRRATFLPQVWEKIPDPAEFLDNLCYKMGVEPAALEA